MSKDYPSFEERADKYPPTTRDIRGMTRGDARARLFELAREGRNIDEADPEIKALLDLSADPAELFKR